MLEDQDQALKDEILADIEEESKGNSQAKVHTSLLKVQGRHLPANIESNRCYSSRIA